jgi:dTMP kinase
LSLKDSPKTNGKFISLEGGEGAGKTTQIKLLAAALKSAGLDSVLTREPGGTPGAEDIRSLLVEGAISRWQPMTEALLHYSARLEHVNATIFPALDAGKWVISDRFSDSTLAYQGYGHGLDQEDMATLHRLVLGDFKPDLTIILDIPDDVGIARACMRENSEILAEDRYERMGSKFHQKVKDGFLDIARRDPQRCSVIDANCPPEEVNEAILGIIKLRFGMVLT